MKFIYSLFFLLAISFSCKQKSSTETTVNTIDSIKAEDTIMSAGDSSNIRLFIDNSPSIVYQGVFPCRDCKGIQQTILFNKDFTFQQEHFKIGENGQPQKSYGNWIIKNNLIFLTEDSTLEIVFRLTGDSLYAINIDNVPITDSGKYKLEKKMLPVESVQLKKKRMSGIDFEGTGSEPFWNIEIRNGKNIKFKLADWKLPVVAPLESINENVDSTVYLFNSHHKSWSVII